MESIQIPVINTSGNDMPSYATSGSAGMDLRAALSEPLTLQSLQRALVPTGLFMEIPKHYEGQVRPRSGLAVKEGITCLNSPGTIDSDYRGEIKVLLVNLSNEARTVHNNDRIAQLVIARVAHADLILVQQLNETERGPRGFGHTGRQ